MAENFADRLLEAVRAKNAPAVVGIDPVYSRLPSQISEHRELNDENDVEAALDAVLEFSRRVIRVLGPLVPAVKLNAAFFERYYQEGTEAYFELVQEGDVDSCVKIIISTLGSQAKEYGDKNRLKGMIYGKQVMTLVAKREKKIVGLITASLLGFPRIMFLTVAEKKSAREGLGGQLIDQLVKVIKKNIPHMNQILHNEFADNFITIFAGIILT